MQYELGRPYVSVSYAAGESYGGSQLLLPGRTEQAVGCGVVAALDLLLYLARAHGYSVQLGGADVPRGEEAIPAADYARLAREVRRRYIPLIPGSGAGGFTLAAGLNRCFRANGLPYRAIWGVPYGRLWDEIGAMLAQDIPVDLSVGPNFPRLWQRHALRLYRDEDGAARTPSADAARAHYVTVTGMDGGWLRVSSWGRAYEIRRDEYLAYVRAHSARLFSNILLIRRRTPN